MLKKFVIMVIIAIYTPMAYADSHFNEIKNGAERGDADAQYFLGTMYYYGDGVNPDDTKAMEWLLKSAEQGNAEAQNELGLIYYYDYEYHDIDKDLSQKQALKWFQLSAYQGQQVAQLFLGVYYYEHKRYRKALYWFKKSAEQGNTDAQEYIDKLKQDMLIY